MDSRAMWKFISDESDIFKSLIPENLKIKDALFIQEQSKEWYSLEKEVKVKRIFYEQGKESDLLDNSHSLNSYDIIFSHGLFQNLSDESALKMLQLMLTWTRKDGSLIFKEKCFSDREAIRSPWMYGGLIETTREEIDGVTYGWETYIARPSQSGGQCKEVYWSLRKVKIEGNHHGYERFQQFLDNQQYSKNGILRYEKIFGKMFVSVGGKDTTEEFVQMLSLKAGQLLLDVGSGIGGSAFYMAEHYGVTVLGIDLSSNMISIAWERTQDVKDDKVRFEICDTTVRRFPADTFDVIYSRDTLLHIPDKKSIFSNFLTWLKPGGKLLISDYCCSGGPYTEHFKAYVAQRGYNLLTVKAYGQLLENVGFKNVKAMDKTDLFITVSKRELEKTLQMKDEFIKEFSEADYNAIISGWQEKIVRAEEGSQKWGLFYAEK